jgi:hypothetical protein
MASIFAPKLFMNYNLLSEKVVFSKICRIFMHAVVTQSISNFLTLQKPTVGDTGPTSFESKQIWFFFF